MISRIPYNTENGESLLMIRQAERVVGTYRQQVLEKYRRHFLS